MSLEDHTDTDKSEHELAKAQLRTTLLNQCVGEENGMSGPKLAEKCPVGKSTVRDLIGELRRQEQMPVFSLGNGYFIITNAEEFNECIEAIDKEIKTREETKRELYKATTGT